MRTLPGDEMPEMSGVVSPTIPIRSPFLLTTTLGTMRPASARARSSGTVSSKPRLAEMKGMSGLTPSMNSASRDWPKSNSWLPSVTAS